ncbi:TonB-dependent receptor domain-containing protein [Phenylobacterium montanum]|uniref:TonB-dependent receptor n=1 Tax=Phenylobacterium montanum TaxID=2823693 RepID=A0A975FYD9_9CAUL|nr:TonB-dependent receptor [Caulobacter sp. S6]QUD87748.1 TonB-dependent receptor [Caulobacter sp. S6]
MAAARSQDAAGADTAAAQPSHEIVVTGSRIRQPPLAGVSAIGRLSSQDLEFRGTMRVEDAINRLPQTFADQTSHVGLNPTGTATVNLRALGPQRTLVLIDGKRLMPGDPTGGSVAPDLNFIPDALVDRIEIVTGGASAVYGSDAVAGVVNFVLKKDFSGLMVDVQAGADNHHNQEAQIQSAVAAAGYVLPPANVTDGYGAEVTLVAGAKSPDGRGDVTLYGGYRYTQPVMNGARDFSACPLGAVGGTLSCFGSTHAPALARFVVLDPATSGFVQDLTLDPGGPSGALRPFDAPRDAYNYAPFEYFQRPEDRYTAGAFGEYQVTPALEVYASGMFMYDSTVAELAPSGLFVQPFSIACSNPMLSAAEVQAFCADAHVPPGGSALLVIGRRDTEAGARQSTLTHQDYRLIIGARGDLRGWDYDLSAMRSAVATGQTDTHDISLRRAADALNVVRNASGALVCASGGPGCVPYDIFQVGGVTKAALAYLGQPDRAKGTTGETVLSASVSSQLERFGLKSPWAAQGLSVAFGAEYRRESLSFSPDAELASGDLAGQGGVPLTPVRGAFHTTDLFGEARAPLAQNRGLLLRDLTLELGYRYSWYGDLGSSGTYKAGGLWSPVEGLSVRASLNHAVRAPNAVELFTPQSLDRMGFDVDPCAGASPIGSAADCARTGVSAAQYGHIVASSEGYNSLDGGNANLRPETADTGTIGIVVAPRGVDGLVATIDYYDIRIRDGISQVPPGFVIEQCLATGDPVYCKQIHRQPGTGSLWLGADGYVSGLTQNTASLRTNGLDLDLDYRLSLPRWQGRSLGSAMFKLVGTYVFALSNVTFRGAAGYDCAGYFGVGCSGPLPHWRHVFRATWASPWGVELSAAWRYIASVRNAASSSNPALAAPYEAADARLGARSYIDLGLSWRIDRRLEFRAGCNNLFDVDPPVVGGSFLAGIGANSNSYPSTYDGLGRNLFAGLTARF